MAMSSFLLSWLTACAQPQIRTEFYRPGPPPAELVSECRAGPDYPVGDSTLGDVLMTVQAREKAAADCRLKHSQLAGWAKDVTRGDLDGGRTDH